jgi:hypothetical protein
MLRPTVSRSVYLGIKHPSEAYDQICITVRQLGLVDVGRPLWWEDGSVVYNCSCSSPAQSFSGPSPVRLATIFYSLRFETSLFVASYDSQGYGGGIRPRLHTGSWLSSKPHLAYNHSARTTQKHHSIFAVLLLRSCLLLRDVFTEPLPRNGSGISAYLGVVA